MERTELVLIGPVRAGKSTLGRLLAEKLGLPQVSLDDVRLPYYKAIGYDEAFARQVRQQEGFAAFMFYRDLFAAYPVERMLSEYHDCVFDFGAGIYESDEAFRRVQAALVDFPNVVLLLPSPDLQHSLQVLAGRDPNPPADLHLDLARRFLQHHTYYDLAKFTVYTDGKTPEQTCQEILNLIKLG
jgi:shikimate kinase